MGLNKQTNKLRSRFLPFNRCHFQNFPFGGFPNLPQPPQLPFFGGLNFPPIYVPSPADIASMSSGPNSQGIMTVSNMASEVGPDGKLKRTGGTIIVTKDGDEEKVIQC